MKITAIMPNLPVDDIAAAREFYTEFLGLSQGFDLGWIVNFRSPDNPLAQVQLTHGASPDDPAISVHVPDVDEAYRQATSYGHEIVHPLTEESWGVRRFFVRAPDGTVVNVVEHDDSAHLR